MDPGIPRLRIKNMFVSNSLKSRFLVRELTVLPQIPLLVADPRSLGTGTTQALPPPP